MKSMVNSFNMSSYVFGFQDIDKTNLNLFGGKGVSLGELTKIEGIYVPDGFCISTEAFKSIIAQTPSINELLDELSYLKVEDRIKIGSLSAEIRRIVEQICIPKTIIDEIDLFLSRFDDRTAYAVRSSATLEDLPTASFAGMQDTYLNIIGKEEIIKHISKCWASLFTERAVLYRLQNSFDHCQVHLAVVVQKMVFPQSAGLLFTADPVTFNRKVICIEAGFGLGEAMVSGRVTADVYKVRNGKIIDKKISTKKYAIFGLKEGGTKEQAIEPEKQNSQALTDQQILRLQGMGRKIEKQFGTPQDIEWCLLDDTFYSVQSRPITTLYPIPEANDQNNHIYVSVGHQQMMTDPMKPLGLSLFQLTALRPMFKAGGRLFVDVTQQLASANSREILLTAMGQHDPLLQNALVTLIERGDFIPSLPPDKKEQSPNANKKGIMSPGFDIQIENDPSIVSTLIECSQTSIEELNKNIHTKSGSDLVDVILNDIQQLNKSLSDPKSMGAIMVAINASAWINEKMQEWLGEKNIADHLTQSVENNITSEMGLALLDVADVIRPYPEVIEYLQRVKRENFLDELVEFEGGQETQDALCAYLTKYGMRCVGEIDITKARWSEKPTTLVPIILSHIKNHEPNSHNRKFEQGRQNAKKKEREILDRLKQLPEGEQKAKETKQTISLMRNFIGYREYPKYGIVNRYFIYKQALLKEADLLVQAKVIRNKEDIYFLTLEELCKVVRTKKLDYQLISKRKVEHKFYEKLTPPRVITSDGEIISGKYKRQNLPAEAIAGLPVSSGVIEGRARVILKFEDAYLEEGDILVTTFTDPSWTPLFLSIKGLVTEVGGLMTHGAVIAREYGLPAIVGVENATKLIKDRQQIRVHGTEGYVEIL